MAAPRGVRFACGHLVTCEACTDELLQTASQRVPQNKCPTCRARIVVVGRASHAAAAGRMMAFEATFVQPSGAPPPEHVAAAEYPRFRVRESALFRPGPTRQITFAAPGLTGFHIRNLREAPERTVITGVTPGSPADEEAVLLGSEIL